MSKRKKFIVISGYSKDDPFGMKKENEKHITFYCENVTDLRHTLRCITPQGYRVRTPNWLRNYMRGQKEVVLKNIFGHPMHTIREVTEAQEVLKALEFTNSFGFTHKLKFIQNVEV